ncbi:beta-galactosidase 14 [Phtheirospermum japonicum]|uniref:Beta-galactosidase 14 n=1 Tax=Phtheirospermum japonicum TaxID=374723 RepID=A0A830C7R0_9LAMI|nr:beta-galactosidase 14 [Phtheirospermum japonicum]
MVVSQHSSRNLVPSKKAKITKWEMYKEMVPGPHDLEIKTKSPKELYMFTNDTSDYAWYSTRYILGRALGGRIDRNTTGWDIEITKVNLQTSQFTSLKLPASISIIECHRDEVCEFPPKAEILARSNKNRIEMFTYGDHVMGIQGHPEYNKDIVLHLIDRLFNRNIIKMLNYLNCVCVLALSPWETIGSVGVHNFMLCKKPKTENSIEGEKSTVALSRKGSGIFKFLRLWFLRVSMRRVALTISAIRDDDERSMDVSKLYMSNSFVVLRKNGKDEGKNVS